MLLQLKYTKKEDIPQQYTDLYTERDGEWHFTGVASIKTQADIDKVMLGLTKERDDHKVTKEKLHGWDGLDRTDIDAKLTKLAELEVTTANSVPKAELDRKLDELTEVRVKNRLLPVERERDGLKKKLEDMTKQVTDLQAKETRRTIHDKVRAAALTVKTIPEVEGDILLLADNVFQLGENGELLTKDNPYGVDAGLTPETFFQVQQEKRPYWWPKSVGGGGKGSGGGNGGLSNPWAADTWNLTEQGAYVKQHGIEKAQQMAKLAGTTVGGKVAVQRK